MRCLSKIVFIQSAHVPYAEIALDGNVHFIGTQGVGKTSLLRAILFFYNADKLHLGIPREKKGFDSFYFAYSNSYIVYEVQRQGGPFFILAFRNQGRVAYKFVDTAYDRDYFVEPDGTVRAEWGAIKRSLPEGTYTSATIDTYDQYRNILYGNRKAVPEALHRFALTESAAYQNIPRTIQNVFLNARLEADFIKDTLISSLSSEEVQIDLDYYRSQVTAFDQQYRDISLWFKEGGKLVRGQADRVLELYGKLLQLDTDVREAAANVRGAVRRDRSLLQRLEAQQPAWEKSGYEARRRTLIREIGALEWQRKDVRKRLVTEKASLEAELHLLEATPYRYGIGLCRDGKRLSLVDYRAGEEALRQRLQVLEKQDTSSHEAVLQAQQRALEKELATLEAAERSAGDLKALKTGLDRWERLRTAGEWACPELFLRSEKESGESLALLLDQLLQQVDYRTRLRSEFRSAVNAFKGHFSPQNTFGFKVQLDTEEDYLGFARELAKFIDQQMIDQFCQRVSDRYAEILQRVSKEVGYLLEHQSEIEKTIHAVNRDFREKAFAGVIRSIELQARPADGELMQLMLRIYRFAEEAGYGLGQRNLFSPLTDEAECTRKSVELLFALSRLLERDMGRERLTLADTFRLQFRIRENDNDTGWVEKIAHVGSDGTDILVKAMINIMLINVFKEKISRRFGDFSLHCMMDEIGKLHPANVRGILDFANARNIRLINSSPVTQNVSDYRYTYLVGKDDHSRTYVQPLLVKKL